MPVTFCETTKQFLLHTDHTTYGMELYDGCLAHVYWGPRISKLPGLDELYPYGFGSGFSGTDLPGRRFCSTDMLPQEYPTFGSADMRHPALHIRYPDGNAVTRLRYASHRIYPGKQPLAGLPAVYGGEGDCETLEITMEDQTAGIAVVLQYTVFPKLDVLTRSARIQNLGKVPCTLERALSFSMDLSDSRYQLIHLPGAWARERHAVRTELTQGSILLDSKRGASSHNENPCMALVRPETTETTGEAMGFCLVYSGSFAGEAAVEQFGSVRAQMGINPFDFSWKLEPGEAFQTPEVILVYSDRGLGEMSRRFHRVIRKHLCRGAHRDAPRPVLLNNWEATYFDFDQEKILDIAAYAKHVGAELMVLDDGWFGKRNDDNCSLGDWVVNREKLPNGLKGLAERVNALGLKFGLWFEPEMVSPDSDLYRKHPDWCIHTPGRSRTEGRNQLILDLSRDEVCDYIVETLSGILESANIAYVKWDMNRNMTEVPGPEQPHRYMLGLYRVLETLTTRFPNVLFEGCSGGGGRFDAGMLCYMPQIWTSDDTDGVERLPIQEGTSLFYPLGTMGAHVSAVPNHQVGRVTPLSFRGAVASLGRYGLELDLSRLPREELEEISRQIRFYRQYEQVIHGGNLYRLESVSGGKRAAYEIISEDGKTVLVFDFCVTGTPNSAPGRLRLQDLEESGEYRDETGQSFPGGTLMHVGIPTDTRRDMSARIRVFERLDG